MTSKANFDKTVPAWTVDAAAPPSGKTKSKGKRSSKPAAASLGAPMSSKPQAGVQKNGAARDGASLKELCMDDKRRLAALVKELADVTESRELAIVHLQEERVNFERKLSQLKEHHETLLHSREGLAQQYRQSQDLLKMYRNHLVSQDGVLAELQLEKQQQQYKYPTPTTTATEPTPVPPVGTLAAATSSVKLSEVSHLHSLTTASEAADQATAVAALHHHHHRRHSSPVARPQLTSDGHSYACGHTIMPDAVASADLAQTHDLPTGCAASPSHHFPSSMSSIRPEKSHVHASAHGRIHGLVCTRCTSSSHHARRCQHLDHPSAVSLGSSGNDTSSPSPPSGVSPHRPSCQHHHTATPSKPANHSCSCESNLSSSELGRHTSRSHSHHRCCHHGRVGVPDSADKKLRKPAKHNAIRATAPEPSAERHLLQLQHQKLRKEHREHKSKPPKELRDSSADSCLYRQWQQHLVQQQQQLEGLQKLLSQHEQLTASSTQLVSAATSAQTAADQKQRRKKRRKKKKAQSGDDLNRSDESADARGTDTSQASAQQDSARAKSSELPSVQSDQQQRQHQRQADMTSSSSSGPRPVEAILAASNKPRKTIAPSAGAYSQHTPMSVAPVPFPTVSANASQTYTRSLLRTEDLNTDFAHLEEDMAVLSLLNDRDFAGLDSLIDKTFPGGESSDVLNLDASDLDFSYWDNRLPDLINILSELENTPEGSQRSTSPDPGIVNPSSSLQPGVFRPRENSRTDAVEYVGNRS